MGYLELSAERLGLDCGKVMIDPREATTGRIDVSHALDVNLWNAVVIQHDSTTTIHARPLW
jgi:hypothetical protein